MLRTTWQLFTGCGRPPDEGQATMEVYEDTATLKGPWSSDEDVILTRLVQVGQPAGLRSCPPVPWHLPLLAAPLQQPSVVSW